MRTTIAYRASGSISDLPFDVMYEHPWHFSMDAMRISLTGCARRRRNLGVSEMGDTRLMVHQSTAHTCRAEVDGEHVSSRHRMLGEAEECVTVISLSFSIHAWRIDLQYG